MATGIDTYSTTAASNTTINSIDIDENCAPSGINNAIRQTMADIRAAFDDIGAKAVSSGTDTVTLTTETGYTAYADGTLLAFIAGGTNTGAATLNVDSVGAKAIRKGADAALAAGDIVQNMLCIVAYDASANGAAGAWLLVNPQTISGYQPLDSDLTTIAGLTATTDNFIQSKSSAWASRTPTQVTADLIGMVGDSGSGGTKGLVPAPASGDAAAGKFLKADGTWAAPSGGASAAAQSDQETATSTTTYVSPGRQQFHPSAAKCWAYITVSAGTPSLDANYNITSIADTGTGRCTVTIATDFSSANWASSVSTPEQGGGGATTKSDYYTSKAAGSIELDYKSSGTFADPAAYNFIGFGDL